MQLSDLDNGLIYTDQSKCIGCNNCLRKCPTLESNVGLIDEETGVCKMHLDAAECILCGTCIDTCSHGVRSFRDDHDEFMADLKKGKRITCIIAPAFLINYPDEYKQVLGYLRSLGVNRFVSVSYGADITTWAYLKYITENNALSRMSQPCPAIVSFAERHQPELLPHIMPIQSPMMCTAIYLKKYMGVTDDLMFLSPCIAKKLEMEAPRGLGMIKYNVTFINLMENIRKKGISLSAYTEIDDEIEYALGSLYPAPGGLRENVEFFLGDGAMVVQSEGEAHVYDYLKHFNELKREWLKRGVEPTLIDLLNCGRGCNYGTATEFKHSDNGAIPVEIHRLRTAKRKAFREFADNADEGHSPEKNLKALMEQFKDLRLDDFMCKYNNLTTAKSSNQANIERAYKQMRKTTVQDKTFDCAACGYTTCEKMAYVISLGINVPENCAEYMKVVAKEQTAYQDSVIKHLKEVSDVIHELNQDNITISADATNINERVENAVSYSEKMQNDLSALQDEFKKINDSYAQISTVARTSNILSINAAIEAAHAGELGKGFSVIAGEMGDLAQKILAVAGQNERDSGAITTVLDDLVNNVNSVTNGIDGIRNTTREIRGNVDNISGKTQNMLALMSELEVDNDAVF